MAALDHEQVHEPGRVGRVVAEQRSDLQHGQDLPAVQRSDCRRHPDVERRAGDAPVPAGLGRCPADELGSDRVDVALRMATEQ